MTYLALVLVSLLTQTNTGPECCFLLLPYTQTRAMH